MKHRVLVTGATGFLGRMTAAALESAGWDIFKVVRRGNGYNTITIDFEKTKDIFQLATRERFDAVVHLAANVDLKADVDANLFKTNIVGTSCLLDVVSQWNAKVIFASSICVLGAKAQLVDDSSTINPDTAYGRSKWLGEQLVRASGVKNCILRFAGIFGANGPAHLGLNRAITAAMNGEVPAIIGTGQARRNYVYVKDAAATIVKALTSDIEGTHLVAGTEVLSISEMIHMLCDVFLPGVQPKMQSGVEAIDQVVKPLFHVNTMRKFLEALIDIKNGTVE